MQVQPRDRILELECGQGELSVALAARAPEGMVVAMDSSPDRVRQARVRGGNLDNVMFLPGGAAEIPWKQDFFSKALSHAFPVARPSDLYNVLRVLTPEGLFYLIAEPHPHSDDVPVEPATMEELGEELGEEWAERLEAAGFGVIQAHHLPENRSLLVGKKPA